MACEHLVENPESFKRSIQFLTRAPVAYEAGNKMVGPEYLSAIPKFVDGVVECYPTMVLVVRLNGTKRVKANTFDDCHNSNVCYNGTCFITNMLITTT